HADGVCRRVAAACQRAGLPATPGVVVRLRLSATGRRPLLIAVSRAVQCVSGVTRRGASRRGGARRTAVARAPHPCHRGGGGVSAAATLGPAQAAGLARGAAAAGALLDARRPL